MFAAPGFYTASVASGRSDLMFRRQPTRYRLGATRKQGLVSIDKPARKWLAFDNAEGKNCFVTEGMGREATPSQKLDQ